MLETSKDLLYIIIAFCILWQTIFMCWLLYYFIMIFKNVHQTVGSLKKKFEMIDEILKNLKEKIDHSATYLGLLVEGVSKLVEYLKDKKSNARTAKKNTKIDN